MKVFVLYYLGPKPDGSWFGKFIGVYSSQARAARTIERLQTQPGYKHYPQGFEAECIEVDEDYDLAESTPPPPKPLIPPG